MIDHDTRLAEEHQARATGRPLDFVRTVAAVFGVAFLAVGILGFIPGITTQYGDLGWAGPDSNAQLFGVFGVSVLHNLVHLASGVLGLACARTARAATWYLLAGGAVYLLLWLYGVSVDEQSSANFVPLNSADDWLHLALGASMVLLSLAGARTLSPRRPAVDRGATR